MEVYEKHISQEEITNDFFKYTLGSIKHEYEIPRFNIVFPEKELNEKCPLEYIEDLPTIIVKDSNLFFRLLTSIANKQIEFYSYYGKNYYKDTIAFEILKRIWLRMGPEDFDNVEYFLKQQLDFLEDREFDEPGKEQCLKNWDEHTITYEVERCESYCESTRRMYFKIHDNENFHDLSKIYYDIREENGEKVCYIFAVQMGENKQSLKNIERKLYKLTAGLEEKIVHPNFLMSMMLFYEMLRRRNITHIKVPILQVLSYRYHTLISEDVKQRFEHTWEERVSYIEWLKANPHDAYYDNYIRSYESDLEHYNRFVDKEDFISKAKTEGLINLFNQMECIDEESEIRTTPFVNATYLDISLNKNRNLK